MPLTPAPRIRRGLIPPRVVKIRVLPNYAPFNFYSKPGPEMLVKLVAIKYELKFHDLIGRSRVKAIADARRQAVRLVYSHCFGMSTAKVGRLFHRDHTSILFLLGMLRSRPGYIGAVNA
jgi:hypothetical protein